MDEFLLQGISPDSVASLLAFLQSHAGRPVVVRVVSPGGDLLQGLAAANAVMRHGQVTAICDGQCASAATAVAAAAATVRATAVTQFMLHAGHAVAQGTAADFEAVATALRQATDAMRSILARRITDETRLNALLDAESADTWLTAEQARELGLVNEVVAVGSANASAGGAGANGNGQRTGPAQPSGGLNFIPAAGGGVDTRYQSQPDRLAAASGAILMRAARIAPAKSALARALAEGKLGNAEANPYSGMRLADLQAKIEGDAAAGFGLRGAVGNVGLDDFTHVLSDAANRAMALTFDAADEAWRTICRKLPVPDFRETSLAALSQFSTPPAVGEHSELEMLTLADAGTTVRLGTTGGLYAVSRRAIINDDLMAFANVAPRLAESAARKVGDDLHALIEANAAWNDGVPIFDGERGNVGDAAPSSAAIDTMRHRMATAKDPNGVTSGQMLAYIWTSNALLGSIRAILASEKDVAADLSMSDSTAANRARNAIPEDSVIPDYRIDRDSATAYYGIAMDGLAVALLDGNETPMVDSQPQFNRDGTTWRVLFDYGVAVASPTRLYRGND